MRLVNELKGLKSKYIIISGNGTYPDRLLLKVLCEKYNGYDKILWYPRTILKKQTGLNALNSLKVIIGYRINSIIFIIDGEHIRRNVNTEIQETLQSIGLDIINCTPLEESLLIKCRIGSNNIILYCIVLGPKTCIEEEVAKLIQLKLNINIDLSGDRDKSWRAGLKYKINHVLKEKKITLEDLIKSSGLKKLEIAFPNICSVLKKIEEDFVK